MTDEGRSLAHIETCRRINRRAAAKYAERGVSREDAAIAAIYSAHDLALQAGHDLHGAIEWLRTGLDVMEAQLLKTAGPING